MLARLKGLLHPRRCLVLLAVFLAGVTTASATWNLPGTGAGAAVASTDFHAPSVTGATVAPQGATAAGGAIQPGAAFVVYANVVDPGGSGVAWVRTDVSSLAAGASAVPLTPCTGPCTIGTTTYGWSSAPITADAGLAQGTLTYGIWGQDNVGNLGVPVSYTATVDSTSPSVTGAAVAMASPATVGWVHRSGSYTVYANATDAGSPASGIATVTADVSSLTPGTTSLALPACTSSCTVGGVRYSYKSAAVTAGSAIADGAVSVGVTASDKAGNTAGGSAAATVDSAAPAVTGAVIVNTTPSDPGYLKPGNNYVVYANATDAGSPASGIGTVTADVSALTAGGTAVTLSACTSSCTYGGVTYGYKSGSKTAGTSVPAGPAAFTVTATDKAANTAPGTYSVNVDTTAPAVAEVAIANTTTNAAGWVRKSGAYAVYANASDASGISSVKANVSTLTSGQTALALTACSTGCTVGGVTYAYKSAAKTALSTLAAGPVSFTVTATDGVGNTTTANGSGTADNTAPTATAEAIVPTATGVPGYIGQGRTYMVYTNAADATGVYSVTASVKNITTGQTALALPVCVSGCTIAGVARGYVSAPLTANASITGTSKTWTVTVTDLAGNAATSASQTVVIDNTAPTVAITFPTSSYAGGWLAGCGTSSTADICGTASDATAGVAAVQVSLRQASAPSLYWNPATSSFSSASEVLMPATGTTSWSLAAASAWFTNLSSYTIRAVATDSASNSATTSTTFTFKP
jgi:hypothetical protein